MTSDQLFAAGVIAAAICAFLLPAAVAYRRRHHQKMAIFATNLLFGWTGIGWCLALIWSLTAVRKDVA